MEPSATGTDKINCPCCRAFGSSYFVFSGRSYYRCPSCNLIYAKREKDIKTVIDYYQNQYFDNFAHDQLSGQRTNIYRNILKLLEKHQKQGSLLDVGCGCGFFLKEARDRGWQVSGVDPSRKSIDYARSLVGESVICGTLDDVPSERRFDAISLINVLDHMVDFQQQLQKIHYLLAPDGILFLRFPNGFFHSFVLRFFRKLSAEQFITSFLIVHEYALTPNATRHFLGDMGFTDIRVLNAPLTGGNFSPMGRTLAKRALKILSDLSWAIFSIIEKLSGGRWVWGPSLQIIARKGTGVCTP